MLSALFVRASVRSISPTRVSTSNNDSRARVRCARMQKIPKARPPCENCELENRLSAKLTDAPLSAGKLIKKHVNAMKGFERALSQPKIDVSHFSNWGKHTERKKDGGQYIIPRQSMSSNHPRLFAPKKEREGPVDILIKHWDESRIKPPRDLILQRI